jgi:hypothetical protein
MKRLLVVPLAALLLAGCARPKPDFTLYHRYYPASILVVPPLNNTDRSDASDTFLASIPGTLAERGYYVSPTTLSLEILDQEGLGSPAAIHAAPPRELGRIFGADAVLYVTIQRWKAGYIFDTPIYEVKLLYVLRDAHDGAVIWEDAKGESYSYMPHNDESLYLTTDYYVGAALTLTYPVGDGEMLWLAEQANHDVIFNEGRGLPWGKYSPEYGTDWAKFRGLEGFSPAPTAK